MRLKGILLLAAATLCPGDDKAANLHPVIRFEAPSDGATIRTTHGGGAAFVPFAATIDRLEEGSVVLLSLDGRRQEDATSVCTPPTCRVEAMLETSGPGWHAAAILIHRPWASSLRNLAGAVSFRVVGGSHVNVKDKESGANAYGQFLPAVRPVVPVPAADVTGACRRPRRFHIIVTAFDRPAALRTLLESLLRADYSAIHGTMASLSVTVHVDAPKPEADSNLRARHNETRRAAVEFAPQWTYGEYTVNARVRNAGVTMQRVESWWPLCGHDAAVWFEDDLEVSPHWFRWLHRVLATYDDRRLLAHQREEGGGGEALEFGEMWERMACVCLQRNWLVPSKSFKQLNVHNGHAPFFYPIIGPLGNVVLGAWWQAFVLWFTERHAHADYLPLVPDLSFTNPWVMSPQGRQTVWTSWFDRFAYETGAHCLYPNLPLGLGLVVNHAGPGLHYRGHKGDDARMLDDPSTSAEYGEWVSRKLYHVPPQPVRVGFDGDSSGNTKLNESHTPEFIATLFLQNELHPMDKVLHLHLRTASSFDGNDDDERAPCVDWTILADFPSHHPAEATSLRGLVETWKSQELDIAEISRIDTGDTIDVVVVTFEAAALESDAVEDEAAHATWSACKCLCSRLHGASRVVLLGMSSGKFSRVRTYAESDPACRLQLAYARVSRVGSSRIANAVFQPWSELGHGRIAVEVTHPIAASGGSSATDGGTWVELHAEKHGMIQDLRESG